MAFRHVVGAEHNCNLACLSTTFMAAVVGPIAGQAIDFAHDDAPNLGRAPLAAVTRPGTAVLLSLKRTHRAPYDSLQIRSPL